MARDRGSACVELVLLTPLLVAFLGCIFFAGQLVLARQAVNDAARTSLQAAVTGSDSAEAAALAQRNAVSALGWPVECSRVGASANVSRFAPSGSVTVTVSCLVSTSNLAFTGLPEVIVLRSSSSGVIEPYRQIGP